MANEDTVLEEAMDNLKEAGQRIRATQSLMRSQLAYAILRPPSLEDAPQIFAEANSLEERLGRLIQELYAFYERGAPYIETDFQERRLPVVLEREA